MDRIALFFLVMVALGSAFSVEPAFRGIQDTGNQNLEPLDVRIIVDCDNKNMTVDVKGNESGDALSGATAFLFYTDYEYQLIGTGSTGSDGKARINVMGNMDYLTALFILRVDKPGYRSKEIEFTYQRCFEAQAPPKPPKNDTTPQQNATNQTQAPPPQDEAPPAEPPEENLTPQQPEDNGTTAPIAPPPTSSCPAGFALLALSLIGMRR
ncbi:MAG: hypothetical protein V2A68_05195 [Candidatus Micrarchaeota archaeon]